MAQPFDIERLHVRGDPVAAAEGVDTSVLGVSGTTGAFSTSDTGVLAYDGGTEQQGQSRLRWLDRAGQDQGFVGDEANYSYLELSPDGSRAAVETLVDTSLPVGGINIWIVDVARGVRTRFMPGAAASINVRTAWSPDNSRLVFGSTNLGPYAVTIEATVGLYQQSINGIGAELLLADDARKVPVSWSPDGRFILYMQIKGTDFGWDLWAFPLFGDRKPFPVVQTQFDDGPGEFSPDSHWITYSSNESGRQEVYIAPFLDQGRRSRCRRRGR